MTILCLHGAYSSASNFKVQLQPFINALERYGPLIDFKCINGGHEAIPPAGFDNFFGPQPLYRFIDFETENDGFNDALNRIRDLPKGLSAEETVRLLEGDQSLWTAEAVNVCLERLFRILDDYPEIDGVLGYSEGAAVAATLIVAESRRSREGGRPRRIKYGMFFAGWAAVRVQDGRVESLVADECDDFIDVPTCHIVGCNDPYIDGSMVLFGLCDEDTALLFDHGKGHIVPRDPRTLRELAAAVETTQKKSTMPPSADVSRTL